MEPHPKTAACQSCAAQLVTYRTRTGGCWFDPWFSQYSFWGLMVVIATGIIPLSQLSIILMMVMRLSSQWFGNNIVRYTGRWFDPRLSQYSFRGLMMVIATGFIPLSMLPIVLTMFTWESSQWLGKNTVWSTG